MAESTELVCPDCRKRYRASGDLGGKHVKCRGCGKVFLVPAQAGADSRDLSHLVDLAAEPDFDSTVGVSSSTWRPNFKYKFPWAPTLDAWLPITMTTVFVVWSVIQTFVSPHVGSPAVLIARLLFIHLLYFLLVVPLALAGLRFAAAKLLFELPSRPRWRVVAVCTLPVMFAYVLWLVNGGISGFLAGLFAGLLLTSLAFWFLIRPQGEEIVPSFGAMSGGMLAGVLLSFLIMLFVNFVTYTVMNSYHAADQFSASPIGPGFSWPAPTTPDQPPPVAPVAVGARPALTQPVTQSTQVAHVDPPAPAETEPSNASSNPFVAALMDRHLPFIKSVREDAEVGSFDTMISPIGYSHWLATVRREKDNNTDVVQCWDVRAWTTGPSAVFPHTPGASAYRLSPDGQLIARPVSFPRAGCVIWSIADSRVACRIDPQFAELPELIGFSDPRTLVTQASRADYEVVELHSVPDGVLIRSSIVPKHSHSPGNCQLSPDGKWLAIAARVEGQVQVLLYDLTLPGKPRSLPIGAFDPHIDVEAAGIAFAPDLSRVTALFEHGGEGICFSWSLPDGSPQPDRTLPGVWQNLARTAGDGGRVFDFLGPDHWLVDGRGVVNINSGRLIATLSPNPSIQWFSDGQTLQLLHRQPFSDVAHIITIKLDPAKIGESGGQP